jgi:hypothetical protein
LGEEALGARRAPAVPAGVVAAQEVQKQYGYVFLLLLAMLSVPAAIPTVLMADSLGFFQSQLMEVLAAILRTVAQVARLDTAT